MATSVSFNGSTYSIPANREARGWGTSLSAFLVDVANSSLSKAGGSFTLTADANFGATYGLVTKYIKSVSSNIAQSGVVRFANNEGLGFRNQANDGDLILKVDTINRLNYNGSAVVTTDSTDTLTNKTLSSPTITGTGAIAGTFTGNLTGNVTGNASGTAANVTGTVAIANGGTGQTTANAALNALLPSQTSQSGKALTTDGSTTAWTAVATTVTTTRGDLIYRGASADTRLAIGATGTVLKGGTDPSWASIVNADIDVGAAIAGSKIVAYTPGTAGVVPSDGLPGITSGSSIGTGKIGELISTFQGSVTHLSTDFVNGGTAIASTSNNTRYILFKSATAEDAVFVLLTPGLWRVTGGYRFTDGTNPTTCTLWQAGLFNASTASGFSDAGSNSCSHRNLSSPSVNGTDLSMHMSLYVNITGSSQRVFLYAFHQGTPNGNWVIGQAWINAERIA